MSLPIIPLDSLITLERRFMLRHRGGVCACVCIMHGSVFEEDWFRLNQLQLLVEYPSLVCTHINTRAQSQTNWQGSFKPLGPLVSQSVL